MSDPRSHYATVLDRELHFMEWGERGRPPLVMWHRLAHSCRDFDDIAPRASTDWHIIVPDTIGRGLSQCSPVPERELPRFLCPPSDRAYCQLQFLGGAECHLPTSLDFDWLTRHGIATHTGRSIPYLQNAETGDLHSLTFLKMLCDHADQVIEHLLTSAPAEVMLVREHGDQAFLGDRPGDFWHGRGG